MRTPPGWSASSTPWVAGAGRATPRRDSTFGGAEELGNTCSNGRAIFFVTNDHSGDVMIERSAITDNVGGSWYPTYPQISNHDDTPIEVRDSVIE